MPELVIRESEDWCAIPDTLRDWLDGGAARWRADVGDDLLGGYARLVEVR